ncbi:hypothetical protein OB955_06280 [Halobacteria archaeon AArc-m2/3/4]|uniref:Uncharacterized protein n=1 Tax=Natronoglomus mannanivorans TaxID=2979990 RepID=A0ABT2QBP9_9EURY|nr:hypothetical protein [Halobacteria archaeon AArc-m2/3/4]
MDFGDVISDIKNGDYDPTVSGDVAEFYCLEAEIGVNPDPRPAASVVDTGSKNGIYGTGLSETERAFADQSSVEGAMRSGWILSNPVPTNISTPEGSSDVIPVTHPKFDHVTDYTREFDVGSSRDIWHLDTKWVIDVPDGYSVFYTHPFNYSQETFSVIPGIVDADEFPYWFRVPVTINVDEGVLQFNDPVVQLVPFERSDGPITADVDVVDGSSLSSGDPDGDRGGDRGGDGHE